jgi:DNA-binding transcriptional ArsR family regulator
MTTTDSFRDATADARPHSSERDASLDATFDALANRRCRALLRHLAESGDALVVDDLADRLADELDDESANSATEARLRTSLHHTHLPKLADARLVEYNPDRGLVRLRPDSQFDSLTSTIDSLESADQPSSTDRLFELLADFRRRQALRTLVRHDDLSLPDLADEVAVAEYDQSLPNIDPDDVLKVYLSLYHTHVPKLAAADLVAYDQDGDHVALTEAGRRLESPLRSLWDRADS